MLVLMCVVLYSIWSRSLRLNYHVNQDELHLTAVDRRLSYIASLPLVVAIVFGLWQPAVLDDAINSIIADGCEVTEKITLEEVVVVAPEKDEVLADDTLADGANSALDEETAESMEEQVNDETTENLVDNGDVL
jgi:hypothetical protein